MRLYAERGVTSPIRSIVVIHVTRALPMISPAYDTGRSEADVRAQWERYYASVRAGDGGEADAASD
jgi:hypothetical protein